MSENTLVFESLFHRPTTIEGKDFIEINDKDLGYWVTLWDDGRICMGATVDNELDMNEIAFEVNGFPEDIDPDIDYYHISLDCETDLGQAKEKFGKLKTAIENRFLSPCEYRFICLDYSDGCWKCTEEHRKRFRVEDK